MDSSKNSHSSCEEYQTYPNTLKEKTLRSQFVHVITGGHTRSDAERDLLAIPVKFSCLQNVVQVENLELRNYKEIPKDLTENVTM